MNTSNVVAANWYRTIYEEIVDRGLTRQETAWPIAFLKATVQNLDVALCQLIPRLARRRRARSLRPDFGNDGDLLRHRIVNIISRGFPMQPRQSL